MVMMMSGDGGDGDSTASLPIVMLPYIYTPPSPPPSLPSNSYVSDSTIALFVVFLLFVVPSQSCCQLFRCGSVRPGGCGSVRLGGCGIFSNINWAIVPVVWALLLCLGTCASGLGTRAVAWGTSGLGTCASGLGAMT